MMVRKARGKRSLEMSNSLDYMKKFFVGLGALAFGGAFWACSTFETAGTSEESEGIVALSGKKFAGAVQKGPFVEGSDVILRETSEEGNLEPTGREFSTKVINDGGDFTFDSLDLKSQYALLSAEGYYTHDISGVRSHCVLHLNAVTNLEKRKIANINLLTHFEYKRVLKLVKDGKTFAEAKRQAAEELFGAFGVDLRVTSAEDLDIYKSSDADRTLYHISIFVDTQGFYYPMDVDDDEWEFKQDTANIDCAALQAYVDSYADDLEDDGILSDSLIAPLAYDAYITNHYFGNVMYSREVGLEGRDEYDLMAERTYFYELVLDHYLGFEECTDKRWGESRKLDKPFGNYNYEEYRTEYVNPAYFLCDGSRWMFTTKGHLDSLKMPIPHGSGIMTDPRDGHKYKTVSFEFEGATYEWMAEDLMYIEKPSVKHSRRGGVDAVADGIYSWAEAMGYSESYMSRPVPESMKDSLHQGVCPAGWHISSTKDWKILIAYVGSSNNLLNEYWRTDAETASAKDLIGVFYNRFDFNLVPMDKKYLKLYYHTYRHESFVKKERDELDSLLHYFEEIGDEEEASWVRYQIDDFRINYSLDDASFNISIDYGMTSEERRTKGRVRCVRN